MNNNHLLCINLYLYSVFFSKEGKKKIRNLKEKEVKVTVVKDKKTPTNNISGVNEECSIVHKNMYEENDCDKIHILNNNSNFWFDDNNDEIVWD